MYKLHSFFGSETTDLEFKEFCLKINKNELINNEKIINMIENDSIDECLQYLIQYNLKEYINCLVPKYLTCFGSASMNGEIVIGVNDYGEITGIPIHDTLNIKNIKKNLLNSIKNTINQNVKSKISDLHNYITIKFEKLEIDDNILNKQDEIYELYEKYCEKIIENNDIISDYYHKKALWTNELQRYCTKLSNIVNTTKSRNELIEYIRVNNKDINNQRELVDLLLTKKVIIVPRGMKIVEALKNKKGIIYWLTEYKDAMVRMMLDKKPKKPTNIYSVNLYNHFMRLTPLTQRLLKNNYDYYILKIQFNLQNIDDEILYKYNKNNKWITRCRTIIDGNPCCF
jgi:hypothetical protein